MQMRKSINENGYCTRTWQKSGDKRYQQQSLGLSKGQPNFLIKIDQPNKTADCLTKLFSASFSDFRIRQFFCGGGGRWGRVFKHGGAEFVGKNGSR